MVRSAAKKAMWVGRATVFMVGLAVMLALVLGVATTALSATGGNFILGKPNSAGSQTSLVGTVTKAAQSALVVINKGTGSALRLQVANTNSPPMKVNSSAKVANLNADQLDGKSDTDFYAAGSKVADSTHADQADSATNAQNATNAANAANANTLDGKDSAAFLTADAKAADSELLDGKNSTDFAAAYKRTVVVSPTGTDTENGQALLDALNGITDASATKPYLLYIEPGTYNLGNRSLQMKSYVVIQGAGELNTIITSSVTPGFGALGCSTGTVMGARYAELRFLTVQNTAATTCSIAIRNNSANPSLSLAFVTAKATASGGEQHYGVYNGETSDTTMTNVTATASGGSNNYGVFIIDSGPRPTMTNVTATASGGANSMNYGVFVARASAPTMTNVTATASGGVNSYGVLTAVGSVPTMVNLTATASGATGDNYGVANNSGSPTIRDSTLSGSDFSVNTIGSGSVKIASTQFLAPVSGSNVVCLFSFDQNMVALNGCPYPGP